MARFDWRESRDLLAAALDAEECPETLEHLAVATFWSREVGRAMDLRQRAYRLYVDRGDRRGAARVATGLALDYEHHLGETAVANGWEERASRLLEDVEPCSEHAWLLLWKAHHAILFHNEVERGRALLAEAADLARRLDLTPVQVMARGLRGLALVSEGKLDEGMRFLDETATAAIAGEHQGPRGARQRLLLRADRLRERARPRSRRSMAASSSRRRTSSGTSSSGSPSVAGTTSIFWCGRASGRRPRWRSSASGSICRGKCACTRPR